MKKKTDPYLGFTASSMPTRRELLLSGLALALFGSHVQKIQAHSRHGHPLKYPPLYSKPASNKKTVMLDPGHGGIDSGAVGHKGSLEKHVVLNIAHHVQTLLRQHPNIDVKMTRESDIFIPLFRRVEIAQQHRADLFVSIHADGFTQPTASGASVFALSTRGASSAMARYLSKRENAADEVAGHKYQQQDNYLQQVLFDLVQTDTINNSLTLGQHVLGQIGKIHHLHSHITEQAAFAVLKSPSIPSILVETSFITNPTEEHLLDTDHFRKKIAHAIAAGILNFIHYYEQHEVKHR